MSDSEKIGVSGLPQQRYSRYAQRGISMNIMVAGSHGLGKTAFTNTFFGQPILKPQPFAESQNNRFWYNQDVCNIQVSHFEAIEGTVRVQFTIIEVDGIGDCVDNRGCYGEFVGILEGRLESHRTALQASVTSLVADARVHLCFYLLAPLDRIGSADIDTMKHISEYTNVVPVISKSDLLDPELLQEHKQILRDQLEASGISMFEDRSMDVLAPFFIISAPTMDESQAYEREYPWGSLNVLEYPKNDLLRLRRFIFTEATTRLFKEVDLFYDRFRISRLAMQLIDEGNAGDTAPIQKQINDQKSEIALIRERIRNKRMSLNNK